MTKRVIWTDCQGDALVYDEWDDDERVVGVTFDGGEAWCYLPTDHDDKVAVAAAFVDALGLEPREGGFRAKAPAKERVPWWEAKGRTVDGFEVVQVENGRVGPVAWYLQAPGDPVRVTVDPDGMVEVDAR